MLTLRSAAREDSRRYWEWANEPAVRAASFKESAIGWDEHERWFARCLRDSACRLYVVIDDQLGPVGQVRLERRSPAEVEVDISIGAEHRGRHLGVEALTLVCSEAWAWAQPMISARVKAGNAASIRMFDRAGFRRVGEEPGRSVVRLEWSAASRSAQT